MTLEDPRVDDERPWRFRVTRHELVDPRALLAHPDNWRAHPEAQRKVMRGAIEQIGFVGEVLVSERSGRILDGHMRVAEAIEADQPLIPVGYVDCDSDEEEHRILASYDPIGTLALLDVDRHREVIERARLSDGALATALAGMAPADPADAASSEPDMSGAGALPVELPEVWGVVVECDDEDAQSELLAMLSDQGYTCRALMS
jgi:hypothetical protein